MKIKCNKFCMQNIFSMNKQKTQVCERFGLHLPDKLGELIFSTHLLGATKVLSDVAISTNFKVHGLLIIRGVLTIAIELWVSILLVLVGRLLNYC